jgi:exopolysaccharide biosynthesis protein
MQVDLSDPTVSMTNTVPGGSTVGFTKGAERLSGQFKRIDAPGSKVIGGINTDFFTTTAGATEGQAQGIFWHNGNCLKNSFNSQKTRPRNFVYWDKEEKVTIAASADYAAVRTSTALQEAFSGGQYLVKDGALASIVEDSVYGVHPRTMFGVQKNKQRIILVVLDGRNSVLAAGMNYPDMQRIMLALGSYDAINLDGGGSSTFIVRDTRPEATGFGSEAAFLIRNMPSDGSERAIGPGLAVLASD